jgi:2-phosphosulfolactate phosphatase
VIDVALTPAQLRDCDVAVVIDVLRATTTITWALGAGYEEVHCVATLPDARALAGADRVLAGERDCVAPPGFDQGNSPREAALVAARELVLASTNGTPAILAATGSAPLVIVASVINLEAVARVVAGAAAAGLVQLVCAGSEGAVALEDVYLAGRLSQRLGGERSDAARTAEALARRYPDPASALRSGAHATRLREAGLESDIADCALESELTVVGQVCAVSERAAVVCAGDRVQTSGRTGVRSRARHTAAVILAAAV